VDFSIILVLPYAALVAFGALTGAALAKRPRPRLIWPFAFSTILAAAAFLRLPDLAAWGYALPTLILLALWAAFGTIIGAMAARIVIAAARRLWPR